MKAEETNRFEKMHESLIYNGYGQYSAGIVTKSGELVREILKAKEEFKPQDVEFVFTIQPHSKITIIVEAP